MDALSQLLAAQSLNFEEACARVVARDQARINAAKTVDEKLRLQFQCGQLTRPQVDHMVRFPRYTNHSNCFKIFTFRFQSVQSHCFASGRIESGKASRRRRRAALWFEAREKCRRSWSLSRAVSGRVEVSQGTSSRASRIEDFEP